MIKHLLPIIFFLIIVNNNLLGINYYVSNSGNDTNNGLSEQNPWKTITKVNSVSLYGGDSVLFKRGDTWRESVHIQYSGTDGNHIVYSCYGIGKAPQILGSESVNEWTKVEGNIWQSGIELNAPRTRINHSVTNHPSSIFFIQNDDAVTWGNMEAIHLNSEGAPKDICERYRDNGFNLMDKNYDWCWGENRIYIYCETNPNTTYSYLEVPQREACFYMSSHKAQNYITIENIEMMYALKYGINCGWPMAYEKRGLNVINCHIAYMGTKGAASAIGIQLWHSDVIIRNNNIHDCGRRNISYNVYSDVRSDIITFENVFFIGNKLHNGYHTTGIDINGGYRDTFKNFVICNNYIWDNPSDDPTQMPNDFTSMGLYLNSGAAYFTNFKVFNNEFKHIKQKHISCSSLQNSFIANNTFYGMNPKASGSGYRQMILVSGSPSGLNIDNNIFYGTINNEYVLSAVTYAGGSESGSTMNNNLYYQKYSNQRIVTINTTGKSYRMHEWSVYKNDTNWDLNSPVPTDPLFVNAPDNLMLMASSTAIGNAINYKEINTDINGNLRTGFVSIGAHEFVITTLHETSLINNVTFYPNPVQDALNIELNDGNIHQLRIYNSTGQLVFQLNTVQNMETIDVSQFNKGLYYIQYQTNNTTTIQKILKQ